MCEMPQLFGTIEKKVRRDSIFQIGCFRGCGGTIFAALEVMSDKRKSDKSDR